MGFNHSLYSYIQIFVGNLDLATEVSIGRVTDKRPVIDDWLIDERDRWEKINGWVDDIKINCQ